MEEVSLMNSHERLKTMLNTSNSSIEEVFKTYIESIKYKPVPDFPVGLQWFNTSEPLSFNNQLKGKLVLLDFFTYCCINCMHILPDLKEIEYQFPVEAGLVVIGVHSAKFDNEKDATNVSNAILRYNIEHAVVNDAQSKIWQQCEAHCWPTLLLISPEGVPLVMLMGEGHKQSLKLYIQHFLNYYMPVLSSHSVPVDPSIHKLEISEEPLKFPGKICMFEDDTSKLLCISDSGNNRIIINDLKTEKSIIVGNPHGQDGYRNGCFRESLFSSPQGVAFHNKDIIYVADTENHAIRRIDLQQGMVSTIAGNGSQNNDKEGGQEGIKQGISSPWDVAVYVNNKNKPIIFVAMAGTHQIWAIFLEDTKWWKDTEYTSGTVVRVAGSGHEQNRNNSYPHNAAFAQPSGLAICQEKSELFIADSESSSIRKLSLIDGKVSGIVGGDRDPSNLFAFGDKDGSGFDGKLQHCLGVAISKSNKHKERVFVADTYNHKIKVVDTSTNSIQTIAAPANTFNEPCGLLQANDETLYVADTNNHVIRVCSLSDDLSEITNMEVLRLNNIEVIPYGIIDDVDRISFMKLFKLEPEAVQGKFALEFKIAMDDNVGWTKEAPQKWKVSSNSVLVKPNIGDLKDNFTINLEAKENDEVDILFSAVVCSGNVCYKHIFSVQLPIKVVDTEKVGKTILIEVCMGENQKASVTKTPTQ